ncbi:MAG: LysR family transcriptional regulator, partial [Alphaproteobacteria bacterium]
MDIDLARTFVEVISARSLVRAAERLHITQAAVSMRIRSLEQQLGRKLLVRNKGGVTLTPEGRRFERYASTMVRIWEQARREVAMPPAYEAILRVGAQAGLWNRMLYRWLPWMRKAAPEIAIVAELGQPSVLMRYLAEGALDIAVAFMTEDRAGIVAEKLLEQELVLISSPDEAATPYDPNYVYVDWGEAFRLQHQQAFPEFNTPALHVGLGTLGFGHIMENGGSGYFPKRFAAPYLREGRVHIVPGTPSFNLPIYAVYPAGTESS